MAMEYFLNKIRGKICCDTEIRNACSSKSVTELKGLSPLSSPLSHTSRAGSGTRVEKDNNSEAKHPLHMDVEWIKYYYCQTNTVECGAHNYHFIMTERVRDWDTEPMREERGATAVRWLLVWTGNRIIIHQGDHEWNKYRKDEWLMWKTRPCVEWLTPCYWRNIPFLCIWFYLFTYLFTFTYLLTYLWVLLRT